MNIEILTTKKKISKSIIKQLEPATLGDLNQLCSTNKIGYYVRDLGRAFPDRVGVFEGINGWKILMLRDWQASEKSYWVTCVAMSGRGTSVKKFKSVEMRDSWLASYNAAKELCLKNHLIL